MKAVTDVEMLVVQKQDLYEVDLQFKKEIFQLFESSTARLEEMQAKQIHMEGWYHRDFSDLLDEPPTEL